MTARGRAPWTPTGQPGNPTGITKALSLGAQCNTVLKPAHNLENVKDFGEEIVWLSTNHLILLRN